MVDQRMNSIQICEEIIYSVFDKAAEKIKLNLIDSMRNDYVRMQLINHVNSVVVMSAPEPDLNSFIIAQSEEETEPVSTPVYDSQFLILFFVLIGSCQYG